MVPLRRMSTGREVTSRSNSVPGNKGIPGNSHTHTLLLGLPLEIVASRSLCSLAVVFPGPHLRLVPSQMRRIAAAATAPVSMTTLRAVADAAGQQLPRRSERISAPHVSQASHSGTLWIHIVQGSAKTWMSTDAAAPSKTALPARAAFVPL